LTACVIEKDDKLSFSITNFERCFSCQGDTETDVSGWFKALDESISLASERKTIEKKSLAIHNLVLNKLLRQFSKEDTKNIASLPHSPFVWNHPCFYQSYGLQQSSTLKKSQNENRKSLKNFKRLTFDVKKEDEEIEEEEVAQTPEISQNTASKLLKINAKRIETPMLEKEDEEDEATVKIVMSEDPMNEMIKGKKSIHLTKKYAMDQFTVSVEGDNGEKFENILDGIVKSDKKEIKSPESKLEDKPMQSPRPTERVKSATNIRQKSQFLIGDDLNSLLSMNPSVPSSKSPSIKEEREVKEKRKKKKQNSVFLQLHNNMREMMIANFDIQIDD
jgi:hypothetical protein